MKKVYTEEHIAWLCKYYRRLPLGLLTEGFNWSFGMDKSPSAIKETLCRNGIKANRPKGFFKGRRMLFSSEQIDFIRNEYPRMSQKQLTEAVNQRFGLQVTVSQVATFVTNHGITCGRTGCYAPGNTPWNDGAKGLGICKPNIGTFRPGNVPGNVRPIGAERICSKDVYVMVKVAETNPFTGHATRFKAKHVVDWETVNGRIPEGKILRFRDNDKTNTDPDNLVLIDRAEHLHLNRLGYSDMPDELRPSLLAVARLDVKTYAREKNR
jgi:hypothetical protein